MKIKCNSVNYRKGFVGITNDAHDRCMNLEVRGIHPDIDVSPEKNTFEGFSDEAFTVVKHPGFDLCANNVAAQSFPALSCVLFLSIEAQCNEQ